MSDDSHEYDEDALEFIEDERVRIAALHATCPKQIWLQVDPEAEQFDGWDAQTWCSDKINETDVRYVLAASRDAEVETLRELKQAWHDKFWELDKQKNAEIAELVAALKPFGAIDLVESRLPAEFAMLILRARAAIAKVRKP